MDAKELSLVAVFVSLSIAMRLTKNIATSIQFVNIPLAFALVSATLYGSKVGFLVGFLSYLLSDLLIFPGIWTVFDSALAGITALIYGFACKPSNDRIYKFIVTFLFVFFFDLLTSVILYVFFGINLKEAIITGLIGLFIPVMGGYLIGVGPLTEFVTALLVVILSEEIRNRKI